MGACPISPWPSPETPRNSLRMAQVGRSPLKRRQLLRQCLQIDSRVIIYISESFSMPKKGQKLIPDKVRKKHLVGVRLTDEEMKLLEQMADREDVPWSYIVRRAVKRELARFKSRKRKRA